MRTSLIFMIAILSTGVFAQEPGIVFTNDSTFDQALKSAKESGKAVFIDCYTVWCGPCKWMSKDVFTQKEVGDYFNSHFISLKMDMETAEGRKLNEKFGIASYPTFLFLNEKGELLNRLSGRVDSEIFIRFAELALDSTQNYPVY